MNMRERTRASILQNYDAEVASLIAKKKRRNSDGRAAAVSVLQNP